MNISKILESHIEEIIEKARKAPSVHNTQPWKVRVVADHIHVGLEPKRILKDGDPTKREAFISLGIFCQAIIVCAKTVGLSLKEITLHDKSVEISFADKIVPKTEVKLASALDTRYTDRGLYKLCTVPKDLIHNLQGIHEFAGVNVWVKSDRSTVERVAQLTGQGIRLALSSPGFRSELTEHLTLPWSKKKDGISVQSLQIPLLLAIMEPYLLRKGLGLNTEAKVEKNRWLSASAVIFITSQGDIQKYWFAVGRAYLLVSLYVEVAGLSQATSAALVEASNFHEDIEEILDTKQRLQAVLRIGKGGKHKRYSPRFAVRDILTSSQ